MVCVKKTMQPAARDDQQNVYRLVRCDSVDLVPFNALVLKLIQIETRVELKSGRHDNTV